MPVYLDNHATTCVDPRVLEKMLPYFTEVFGNAGSSSHLFGWRARDAVDQAREAVAKAIGASTREIVFTSGATESNNLAIRGLAERRRRRGNHIISVKTEHKSVLDPLTKLQGRGFEVTYVPVESHDQILAGCVLPERVRQAMRDDTLLVTVMLANNEIGVIQPIAELGRACRQRGIPLHCDATQAVGRIPIDVDQLGVDLMSFSGHKIYGPKGIGGLYVRRRGAIVRLTSQIDGGGQEGGTRSGTLNVPGIVGMAHAIELCCEEMEAENERLRGLRNRLFHGLCDTVRGVTLNGPALQQTEWRLAGNLNCSFDGVDGEAVMMSTQQVAVSSGSACTSVSPEPSHVLGAIGLPPDRIRGSLRFGLGRFNTQQHIDIAIESLADTIDRLRRL